MKLVKAWTSLSLIKQIVIGLVVGAILALIVPNITLISLLGTLFVAALKAVAPVLVFFLVISALATAKIEKGAMGTVIGLYVVSTLIAGLVAVGASFLFPSTLTLIGAEDVTHSSPANVWEVLNTVLMNAVANPIDALMNANYIGILVWAIVLGIALRAAASNNTKTVFTNVSDAVSIIVRWVILCAPYGILGLVYTSISESGLDIFVEYGHLLLVLVGCMLFIALVTNPLLVFWGTRKNPYPLVLRALKDSGITAFFTRSSAANIPVNLELCRRLGIDKDVYSVSIPLGATINMAGAAVTIAVMTMATCATMGISVDFASAFILCILAAVSACGASGVAGGSLLLIPLACSLFGIPNEISMQVVAIGFIIGVVQDSCETALNSSSDALFTATADYRTRRLAGIPFNPGHDAQPLNEDQIVDHKLVDEMKKVEEAEAEKVI